jgi:hypothetical protein
MPMIDDAAYAAAEETQGGFSQMEPGAYMLRIKKVLTEWEERDFKTQMPAYRSAANGDGVMFVFDVDEGDHAGEFSREFFMDGSDYAENKNWMHQVKYTWGNLGKLKRMNNVLAACNPGFDPMAALKADQWQMFIGRRFGAVLNGTVKTNQNGYDSWTFKVGQWITEDELRAGQHDKPKVTDKRDSAASSTTAVPADTNDDIPF